jgi:hypothetical protein
MKVLAFIALAVLAGVVATSNDYAWTQGHEYVYNVRGRLMQGVSVINNQHAGFEIQYKLYVKLINQDQLAIKPENVQIVQTEEEFDPREGDIEKGKDMQLTPEMKKALESPIIVTLRQGVPQKIKVRNDLPQSIINVKRAQVSQVIVDTVGTKVVLQGNKERQTNSVHREDKNDDSGFFFETLEKTVHGECETYYTVSQTGPYQSLFQREAQDQPAGQLSSEESNSKERRTLVHSDYQRYSRRFNSASLESSSEEQQREMPWPKAFNEFCKENDQIYEIFKVVNFTSCTNKPVLSFFTPAELLSCRPGDNTCGSIWDRALVSRILACGSSRRNYNILQINQEEQFNFGLRDEERIVSVGVKNITIEQINKGSSSVHYSLDNSQTVDLIYEFSRKEQRQQLRANAQGGSWLKESMKRSTKQQYRRHQSQEFNSQESSSFESTSEERRSRHQNSHEQQYRHSERSQQYRRYHNRQNQDVLPFPPLKEAPLRPLLISPVTQPQMKERIRYLVLESVKDIHDEKRSVAQQETLSKISVAAKVIRFLPQEDILHVYNEIIQKATDNKQDVLERKTIKNFMLDAMVMAGTNPAITAVMKLIENKQVVGEKATQLVMTFALYIRHPTPELRERFFSFLKSSAVQEDQQLRTTTILTFSVLLNQACINARVKQSRYNVALYGEFCQVQDTTQYFEYFVNKLNEALRSNGNHWTNVYLTALGNIGHPRVVKVVQRVLDDSNDPIEKAKAIYALKNVIVSREAENTPDDDVNQVDRVAQVVIDDEFVEKKVLPILVSVAFDRSEHPMVRMAAVQMLVYTPQADVAIWQQLALSTWNEISQEVHSFIYSTLKNLAQQKTVLRPLHGKMVQKASAVLSLAKDFDEGYFKSRNTFQSGHVEDLNSGYFQQFSWMSAKDSIIPSSVYFRNYLQFGNGAFGVNPIEFALQARTVSQIADVVAEKLDISSSSEESGEKNPIIREIKNLLQIEKREMDETPHGSIYINIRNEIQRIVEVNVKTLSKEWKQKALLALSALRQGVDVNYQKVIQVVHHSMEMPTMFGVPLIYKQRLPVMVSVVGKAKLQGSRSDGQVQAQLEVILAGKLSKKVAVKVPYLAKKYEAGTQRHIVIDAPFRATVRVSSKHPITFAITPTNDITGQAGGKIELFTYHQRPYTAIITDELYPTVHHLGGVMNIVNAEDKTPVYDNQETYGKESLGWAFRTEVKSDYQPEQESMGAWSRFLRRFHTPGCFLNLGVFGPKTIKYAERKLILDVDESSSKTLVFAFAAKRGSSSLDGTWSSDLSSSSSSSSSSSESDSTSSQSNSQSGEQHRRYIHGSSSSSSSSESNSASDSNENSKEVFNRARVIAIAVFGKSRPIPNIEKTSSIFNNLDQNVDSKVQYLLQVAFRKSKFYIRAASGNAANHAAKALPTESESLEILRNAIMNAKNSNKQQDYCIELGAKYRAPAHANQTILLVLRKNLLQRELKVEIDAQLKFGEQCDNMPHKITLDGELFRSPEMTKWADKESPEAKICEEDEKKGFTVSDTCLEVANTQAAALNKWRLTAKWSKDMPYEVKNITRKVQSFAKYLYYPYISQNYAPEREDVTPERTLIFDFEHTPNQQAQYWKLLVRHPSQVLAFEDVRSGPIFRTLLPLTATQTLPENIMNYLGGNDTQPTCQIEGRYFSTFDNVVARFNPEFTKDCYHLLAADCSGDKTMAISAKNLGTQNIKVKAVFSRTTITVGKPQSGTGLTRLIKATQPHQLVVTVDGQQVTLPFTVRRPAQKQKSNDYIARIKYMPNGGVQIETPRQDLAILPDKVVIYGDDTYRNVTCGICGDFDGEKVAEFRSPRDVPLSSGNLLVASYAYSLKSDSGNCHVDQTLRQRIRQEEKVGFQGRSRQQMSRYQRMNAKLRAQKYSFDSDSSSSSSESYESKEYKNNKNWNNNNYNQNYQPVYHHPLRVMDGQVCISEEKFTACRYPYKGQGGQSRQVKFYCVNENNSVAKEMKRKAKNGETVDYEKIKLLKNSQPQHFSVTQDPKQCERQF